MVGVLLPTSYLPLIKRIPSEDINSLNASITYLQSIYNPEVRGSRRRKPDQIVSTKDSATIHTVPPRFTDQLTNLRSDPFERAYAIKWLTALISLLDSSDLFPSNIREKEKTIQNAASLLAVCAGTSAAGKITRDFTFSHRSPECWPDPNPLTIRITDISLDNDNFGSMGAQTWGGACVLSDLIAEDPESFGLSTAQLDAHHSDAFRILELGAGTGLVSLTVGKVLQQLNHQGSRHVEIIATDYYPSVLENLRGNIEHNLALTGDLSTISITVHALDWSKFDSSEILDGPFEQPFDLVLGADIVYEPEHAPWLRSCLVHLLRKSSSHTKKPLFHLVIPLRSTHAFESSSIETIFTADGDPRTLSLQVMEKDVLSCDTDTGEEVEYAYYKIGWIYTQHVA